MTTLGRLEIYRGLEGKAVQDFLDQERSDQRFV